MATAALETAGGICIDARAMDALFDELFPICRSITGPGLRHSLAIFQRHMPLQIEGVASGSQVFDWTVPPEWRIRSARLTGPDGAMVADLQESNLSVVNYSAPVDAWLTLSELREHLHTVPALPSAIPYVTSYYRPRWGFCLPYNRLQTLQEGTYHARIDSEFVEGAVEFGQCVLPGETEAEIVLSSYLCHPSLANNELSGPLALLAVYNRLSRWPRRRFTYRFILNPETIGSLCYLSRYGNHLRRKMAAGLVLTCLGGPSKTLTYQLTRRGNTLLDRTMGEVAKESVIPLEIRAFDPTDGSDERQYCSPGFNLPMGQIARTVYGRYPEYHTSLDSKEFMDVATVARSASYIEAILKRAEISWTYRNLAPYGEPQLGKRHLFPSLNSPGTRHHSSDNRSDQRQFLKRSMMILNYSDGRNSMIDIANRCGCTVGELEPVVEKLEQVGLLAIDHAPVSISGE
jgi:aminopeptidase-like protein